MGPTGHVELLCLGVRYESSQAKVQNQGDVSTEGYAGGEHGDTERRRDFAAVVGSSL